MTTAGIAEVAHGIPAPGEGPAHDRGDFTGGANGRLEAGPGLEVVPVWARWTMTKNSWDAWLIHCWQIAAREDFDANERD